MRETVLPRSFWWAVASLVVMVVGAVGPWAEVLSVTIDGIDGSRDGWVVIGAAAVAALLLLVFAVARRAWLAVFPLLAGAVGGATAGYDISDIRSLASETIGGRLVETEWGIYVALAGSISLIVASLALMVEGRGRRPAAAAAPPPPAGPLGA